MHVGRGLFHSPVGRQILELDPDSEYPLLHEKVASVYTVNPFPVNVCIAVWLNVTSPLASIEGIEGGRQTPATQYFQKYIISQISRSEEFYSGGKVNPLR